MVKLDTEVAWCSEGSRYPKIVRNQLMKLNRSVCINYPEYNLPWMHEQYVLFQLHH